MYRSYIFATDSDSLVILFFYYYFQVTNAIMYGVLHNIYATYETIHYPRDL